MDSSVINSINRYTELVKEILPVSMVILYGSYAKGTEKEWSDIDIAVVTDKFEGDIIEAEYNLFKLRRQIDDRIEPVLFRGTDDKSGFLESILTYGKIIYRN